MKRPSLFTCASVVFPLLLACSESNTTSPTSDSARPVTRAPEEASAPPSDANGADGNRGGDSSGVAPDARAPQDAAGRADAASTDAARDAARPPARNVKTYVYQGGNGSPYPVRTFVLDRATGTLSRAGRDVDLGPNPTYLTPSADHRNLYAANEAPEGGVTVASISDTGSLSRTGSVRVERGSSWLNAMVFTALSPNGKFVLAANYYGPSVSVFARAADGSLSGPVATQRFEAPAQSHSVRVHPSGKWVFVPNKDADAIAQLRFDETSGKLTPNTPAQYTTPRGAGPRHIAFSPDGAFAYVSNENDNTVSAYRVTAQGLLEAVDTESLLPADYSGRATGAHVLVHPNGKYVYASVRGPDQIAAFRVDDDGGLTPVQQVSTRGRTPRNFDIDERGEFMVVANQDSGSLAVFRIQADGTLSAAGDLVTGLQEPNAVAIVNFEE
jgi:6-phosphogluconolactonase